MERFEDRVVLAAPTSPSGQIQAQQAIFRAQHGATLDHQIYFAFNQSIASAAGIDGLRITDPNFFGTRFPIKERFNMVLEGTSFTVNDDFEDGSDRFKVSGLGNFSNEKANVLLNVTERFVDATTNLTLDALNASNPDLFYQIQTPQGITPTVGVGAQSTSVSPAQSTSVVLNGSETAVTRVIFANDMPLGGFLGITTSPLTVQMLVVVEVIAAPGWNITQSLTGGSTAQRDLFAEIGEALVPRVAGGTLTTDFQNGSTTPFSFDDFKINANGSAAAAGSEAVVRIKAFSPGISQFVLTDVAEIKFQKAFEADLSVAPVVAGEAGPFGGIEVFEKTSPTNLQTVTQSLLPLERGVYQVNIQNQGTNAQQFVLKSLIGVPTEDFAVRYFVGEPSTIGEDITTQIIGMGFTTPSIPAGGTFAMTVEIEALSSVNSGNTIEHFLQAFTMGSNTATDTVKLSAVAQPTGDLLARALTADGDFVGNDIFEGPIATQDLSRGETIDYLICIENEHPLDSQSFLLHAELRHPDGLTIQFLNATTSEDVTAAFLGTGAPTGVMEPGSALEFLMRLSAASTMTLESIELEPIANTTISAFLEGVPEVVVDSILPVPNLLFPADLAVNAARVFHPQEQPVRVVDITSVSYVVDNIGNDRAIGTTQTPGWNDALFLDVNGDGQLYVSDGSDIFLGMGRRFDPLNGQSSYEDAITFTVPGVAPGTYHLLLVTDFGIEVTEDTNRSNNQVRSVGAISIENIGTVTPPTVSETGIEENPDNSFTFSGNVSGTEAETISLTINSTLGPVLNQVINGLGPFEVNILAGLIGPGQLLLA